jgi:hypothetical protein
MLKENNSVVTNKSEMPARNKKSAIGSNLLSIFIFPLIDKKERMQLDINSIIATVVNSSIKDFLEIFKTFKDVKTIKQIPSKFDEAFKIWGDLLFCFFSIFKIIFYCSV